MSAFIDLLAKGAIDVEPLVTHRYSISDAERAYEIVTGGEVKKALAIVLEYPDAAVAYGDARVQLRVAQRGSTPAPVRLGVIGAGQFAKGILLPEFRKQKQVQVIGLCTASGLTSRNAGERYGAEYCTSDSSQIMNDERINAVVIATRNDQHASLIANAIRAGKAVFCEKPLASTRDGLGEVMAALAAAPNPRLMIGFNRRFSPLAQKCRAFIREGNAPQSILYRVNAGPVASDSWVLDPVSGGGRIIGEVCHFIDFACFLSDSLPVRIFAEQVAIAGEGVADRESVSVIVTLADGSVATIQYTSSGDPSVPKERIEVASASRMAILDNFRSLSLHSNNARRRHRLLNQSKGHREEVAAFVGAVTDGTQMPVDIETLLAVTRATFAIEESLALRGPVET
jgi:predicted dehydrogenase